MSKFSIKRRNTQETDRYIVNVCDGYMAGFLTWPKALRGLQGYGYTLADAKALLDTVSRD